MSQQEKLAFNKLVSLFDELSLDKDERVHFSKDGILWLWDLGFINKDKVIDPDISEAKNIPKKKPMFTP